MRKLTLLALLFILPACALAPGLPVPGTSAPAGAPSSAPSLAVAGTSTAPAAGTAVPAPPGLRRPRGIYAVVDINGFIATKQGADHSPALAGVHAELHDHLAALLADPAVSGLTVQIAWSRLNPHAPGDPAAYDWSWLDDAFNGAAAWNSANPSAAPKTLQLQVFPGFFTPRWLLDQIPSCDGLFEKPVQTPPADCGKGTFVGSGEPHGNLSVLPMPWNALYKSSWKTFLQALAARYGPNPLFVSIDVAGPTAASTETIEPSDSHTPELGNISGHDMWLGLLAFAYPDKPAYQKSDQAFIDEWEAAIDMFAQVFSNVTLVVTHGSGLPDFPGTHVTLPPAYKDQCPTPPGMDCAAEATIMAYFADPSVGGTNAKAVQGSGLSGHTRPISNILTWMAQTTAQAAPSGQILEGEQLGTGTVRGGIAFGCASPFPPDRADRKADPAGLPVTDIPADCLAVGVTPADLTGFKTVGAVPATDLIPPEQSLYNILKSYFNGTPAAASFGGTPGGIPHNYLQIYNTDILYVTAHAGAPVKIVRTDGSIVSTTAQDLLNLASQKLLEIAEPPGPPL